METLHAHFVDIIRHAVSRFPLPSIYIVDTWKSELWRAEAISPDLYVETFLDLSMSVVRELAVLFVVVQMSLSKVPFKYRSQGRVLE